MLHAHLRRVCGQLRHLHRHGIRAREQPGRRRSAGGACGAVDAGDADLEVLHSDVLRPPRVPLQRHPAPQHQTLQHPRHPRAAPPAARARHGGAAAREQEPDDDDGSQVHGARAVGGAAVWVRRRHLGPRLRPLRTLHVQGAVRGADGAGAAAAGRARPLFAHLCKVFPRTRQGRLLSARKGPNAAAQHRTDTVVQGDDALQQHPRPGRGGVLPRAHGTDRRRAALHPRTNLGRGDAMKARHHATPTSFLHPLPVF
mmetsp:Transcript_8073/g.14517  ORF Transcript_8073/g.14517 Transcript_8073/m.14517 type:complete len:256 (-) Transcript_8073:233-1000(-)